MCSQFLSRASPGTRLWGYMGCTELPRVKNVQHVILSPRVQLEIKCSIANALTKVAQGATKQRSRSWVRGQQADREQGTPGRRLGEVSVFSDGGSWGGVEVRAWWGDGGKRDSVQALPWPQITNKGHSQSGQCIHWSVRLISHRERRKADVTRNPGMRNC